MSSYLCGLCDLIPFRKRGGRQRAHDLELEEESVGFGFIFGVGVMALLVSAPAPQLCQPSGLA